MADRARNFAARLEGGWTVDLAYRRDSRRGDIQQFAAWLAQQNPDVVYVFDLALAGVAAALLHRLRRGTRFIVDTGDAITALARALRSPLGVAATAVLERVALKTADHIVVRGSFHQELLAREHIPSTVIPDGVDLSLFTPRDGTAARRALGLGDALTVGIVGSCVWSPALQIAYGWDMVELLGLVRDLPVKALLVGDGNGISHLRQRAKDLRVEDRIVFAGRRPMSELPDLLSACDVCLSTQTNDIPGNVRTTGKLPLYLACGRYVLASDVGQARYVLPEEMRLPYEGTVDRAYPARLAARVREIAGQRARLELGAGGVAIARQHFDYDVLAKRVVDVLSRSEAAAQPAQPLAARP
jgi:glycosyltransferase involved in cell wall biosynthesis